MAISEVTTSGSRLRVAGPPATLPRVVDWGWLPALSVIAAFGSVTTALAYTGGRMGAVWASPLLWISPLIGLAPAALRLFSSTVARHERIGILVVLGIELNLIKAMQYPLDFQETDALRQWRTAQDIAATNHLFQFNPVMTISPWYPGLEIVANAMSDLTGISTYHAEVVVISVARLLLVLSLYLFYEHVSGSERAAGIATLLYMANPHYVYFDGTLSYESLALPLCAFALFAVSSRLRSSTAQRKGMTLAIWLGMGALVITHHLTSYAFVAFLVLWTAMSLRQTRYRRRAWGVGGPALLGVAMIVGWSALTGFRAMSYLGNTLGAAENSIVQTLTGALAPRQLFTDYSGSVTSFPERALVFSSVGLTVIGLAFGLPHVWRNYRTNATALLLAAVAVGYPVSQMFRFTAYSGEISDRATEFVFVGVAFVLACAATQRWLPGAASPDDRIIATWHWLLGAVSSSRAMTAAQRWLAETATPAALGAQHWLVEKVNPSVAVAQRWLVEEASPAVAVARRWLVEEASPAVAVARRWLVTAVILSYWITTTWRWQAETASRRITVAWRRLAEKLNANPRIMMIRRWLMETMSLTVTAIRRWLMETVSPTVTATWHWLLGVAQSSPTVMVTWRWLLEKLRAHRMSVAVSVFSLVFLGMMLAGSGPPWYRMPGPYLVSADVRSITPEGIGAAQWAGAYLGPNQRIATDRVDTLLQATYGHEWPVTSDVEHIPAELLFTSSQFGPAEQAIARKGDIRYLVVDTRLSSGLPRIGYYFTKGEPNAFKYTTPIDPAALTKFDHVRGISRLFDSGNIVIYDVGGTYGNP